MIKNMKKIYIAVVVAILLSTSIFADTAKITDAVCRLTEGSFANDAQYAAELSKTLEGVLKPQNILVYMMDSAKNILSGKYTELAMMLSAVFIASVTEIFSKNTSSLHGIADYTSLLALMSVCFSILTPLLASVAQFLEQHSSFMTAMTSASGVLLAASGSAGSAAASSVSASFITAFTQICSVSIIFPAVKIIIALSSVGAISGSMDLSGVTSFLKSFCLYGTGLLFAVFLSVHALTLSVSSGTDSLAFRSLRFTAARLIPVAGGMISESIKTVLAGMNVIKNAAGGVGIAYIIYTAIPAVFSVLYVKTAILITLVVSKLLGAKKQASFLDGINGACNLIFAICIFASFSGIIILAVFMKTSLVL